MAGTEERDGVSSPPGRAALRRRRSDQAGPGRLPGRGADRIVPELADRPLSVIRVRPGQPPFMQKNLPKYTPDWVRTVGVWAEGPAAR